MVAFPSFQLSRDFVKARFLEESAPVAIAQRWLGMPRGIYLGFIPIVSTGSDVLTLDVDPNNSFSLLKVGSASQPAQVDLFHDQPLALNFTGHTQWPVYVLAKADMPIGGVTRAEIFTRATPASGPGEVNICLVDKPATDLTVDVTVPTNRHTPVAFGSQQVGYMSTNAIIDLASASSSVAEIIAARVSPFTGPQPSLSDRINTDLSGTEMANRLGLRLTNVVSNAHTGAAAATVVNVSGSFTETGREFGPTLTIESGGDESTEGAVIDPTRNFCYLIDESSGRRIIDSGSDEVVYGQLSFTTGTVGLGNQIRFFNATTTVDGNGTNPFTAPLEEGDIVLGPDAKYYEIRTIIDPDNAELGAAFQGTTGDVVNTTFRRFELSLFTTSGAFALAAETPIRFTFPAFFRTDRAIFDGTLLVKKDGERPPVPLATTSTPGKGLLATAGGLVGSVRTIKNAGSSIGNDFHTLNFVNSGATNAGGGVANVAVTGLQGPDGPGANQGPDGPSGPAGPGYSVNNTFESSSFSTTPTPSSISHTIDFSGTAPALSSITHLFGGFSGFDWGATFQVVRITNIQITGGTTGQITGDLQPGVTNARFKLFLGAMQ